MIGPEFAKVSVLACLHGKGALDEKGCVFRTQQVLPQRALALKEIKNGLHHVGRYPDLKARELSTR